MTRRGQLTEDDRLILEYLDNAGASTTMEIADDTLGHRTYARLMRLFRWDYVGRIEPIGGSRSVLWVKR